MSDALAPLHPHRPGAGSGLTLARGLPGLQQPVRGLASAFQFGVTHQADVVQPGPAPVLTVLDGGHQQHPWSAEVQGLGVSRGMELRIQAELHRCRLRARTAAIHVDDDMATTTMVLATVCDADAGERSLGKPRSVSGGLGGVPLRPLPSPPRRCVQQAVVELDDGQCQGANGRGEEGFGSSTAGEAEVGLGGGTGAEAEEGGGAGCCRVLEELGRGLEPVGAVAVGPLAARAGAGLAGEIHLVAALHALGVGLGAGLAVPALAAPVLGPGPLGETRCHGVEPLLHQPAGLHVPVLVEHGVGADEDEEPDAHDDGADQLELLAVGHVTPGSHLPPHVPRDAGVPRASPVAPGSPVGPVAHHGNGHAHQHHRDAHHDEGSRRRAHAELPFHRDLRR